MPAYCWLRRLSLRVTSKILVRCWTSKCSSHLAARNAPPPNTKTFSRVRVSALRVSCRQSHRTVLSRRGLRKGEEIGEGQEKRFIIFYLGDLKEKMAREGGHASFKQKRLASPAKWQYEK